MQKDDEAKEKAAARSAEQIAAAAARGRRKPRYLRMERAFMLLPSELGGESYVGSTGKLVLALVWSYQQDGEAGLDLPLPQVARFWGISSAALRKNLAHLVSLGLVEKIRPDDWAAADPRPSTYRVSMAAVLDVLAEAGVEGYAGWDEDI